MTCDDSTVRLRRYGTTTPEAERQDLTHGRMRLLWHAGAVRHLHFDGVEVLRGLSMVIRDARWGTHGLDSIASEVNQRNQTLELWQESLLARRGEPVLRASLACSVSENGLDAHLHLRAERPFETCRSGLVALLPLAGVVGHSASVIHDDGTEETGLLDERISPAQPFFSIRRLQLSPGPRITLEFDGDVFEMEDQRNWSDASFKIYNRPLAWLAPYRLEAGECVQQHIRLSIEPRQGGARDV